ncbi:other/TTK protein kinase [Desarmillaria tabescens]|uniref:Other/TTK protein kinase n=1 Tax=Armillaria tabescens TaxID=1929756 RepID=A0AA39NFI7_ARMTA|nr:other/TTK protein kinase [Desarmillaria tabescens]KAK0464584.1 other/TTK protein kinase [Desarmillaria tabescens]
MASTPPQERREPSASPASTESSDSSELDLSFTYVYDDDGNFVRLSKGSPKSQRQSAAYSPATSPLEVVPSSEPVASSPSPNNVLGPHGASDSDLVSLTSPRPPSLTRSESAFPILSGHNLVAPEREIDRDSAPSMARSFQRVASGPAIAMSIASASTNGGAKRLFPRRVVDELQEARQKRNGEELRARLLSSTAADSQGQHLLSYPDEKENIGRGSDLQSVEELYGSSARAPIDDSPAARLLAASRPAYASLSSLSAGTRPVGDLASSRRRLSSSNSANGNRNSRILKGSGKKHVVDRISELDQSTDEEAYGYEQVSDHGHDDGTDLDEPQVDSVSRAPSREGVLSLSQSKPRRSASLSGSDEPYRGSISSHARSQQSQSRSSRPGTGAGPHRETGILPRRVTVEERDRQETEQRAESKKYQDVERRLQEEQFREQHHPSQDRQSPTHVPSHVISVNGRPSYATHRRRESDTLKSSVAHSGSPTAVDVPPAKPSSANNLAASASVNAKHRRSPTAPEPPTTSENLRSGGAGDEQREKEKERHRQQRQHSIKQASSTGSSQPISASLSQQQLAAASMGPGNRHLVVNRKLYARLDMIGKGGSSRVYRVMNHANELYAIKRVSLDKIDSETMSGYMNEIALLKRLEGNSRIIGLVDSELKAGPGGSKGHLLLVMECGEIDFARLLSERQSQGLDMVWVAYYWQQMLQAVHVIHEEKIVHSDLKPANFVLVKGQLKLIDFGIANAIANDTTNIQRDHQIGTVNYMSPEAIEVPDGMRRHKVGRASDIWSLGCILYQMVYGQPPFHHLAVFQKMKAIPDATHRIDFPLYATPTVPSSNQKGSPGHGPPPKKLEHLKRRIRMDIILSMRTCLNRNPKERMSIPQLLEQDWLAMKDPPPTPTIVDLLGEDETVITPFYMKQLLEYGIRLGKGLGEGKEATEKLLEEDARRLVKELRTLIVKKEGEH